MTELEKLERGFWYDANFNPELLARRDEADELCFCLNATSPRLKEKRAEILHKLLPHMGREVAILSPFYTDYGYNCFIGDHTFLNHHAHLMDGAPIKIGSWCFIGPNCGMYTAMHPLIPEERNTGLEKARPITIGNNVWIGGDVTILPGVTIGEGAVIGAKSLVSRDIPPYVVAVGNPCRVVRKITEKDSIADIIREEAKHYK